MKVTNGHLRIALLVLGGILILYGILKLLLHFDFGPLIDQNLGTVVMVGAAVIFIWNRQIWNAERKRREEDEAAKGATEQNSAENDEKKAP